MRHSALDAVGLINETTEVAVLMETANEGKALGMRFSEASRIQIKMPAGSRIGIIIEGEARKNE